jgi:hypothetical protein
MKEILIAVKASEELPPISPDYKKQQISDDYIVSTIKGLENFSYYDHKVGKWATWNDYIEYWYKPVSKAEYDKQVLAEKIDELLPSEHWMEEKADEFQRNTGASISSTSSYLFGMGKIVDYIKTKLL